MEQNKFMKELSFEKFNINIYKNSSDCKDKVLIPKLAHGSKIIEVITGNEDLNDCDALFTKSDKFELGIRTADCASVCCGDGKYIGIAHIGWPGLSTDLLENFLEKFDKSNLDIFVGPLMRRFEIQRDFCYDKLEVNFKNFIEYENGKMFFNFKDALLSVLPEKVVLDDRNTFLDLSLPSYRRDKTKDRLLTVISDITQGSPV